VRLDIVAIKQSLLHQIGDQLEVFMRLLIRDKIYRQQSG